MRPLKRHSDIIGSAVRAWRCRKAARSTAENDIVDACVFLLENSLANGIDLSMDGGRP